METVSLLYRYAVMQRTSPFNDKATQVGVVTANSYSHAHKKAMQLFNRHVWVERLT